MAANLVRTIFDQFEFLLIIPSKERLDTETTVGLLGIHTATALC